MPLAVDFTGATEGGLKPAGVYGVTIYKAEEVPGQGDKAGAIKLTLKVQDGDFAGQNIFDRLFLSPKAKFRIDMLHAALSKEPLPNGPFELDATDYIGESLCVELVHEADRVDVTKTWERVKRYLPAGADTSAGSDALPWAS